MPLARVYRPLVDTDHPSTWSFSINGSSALSATSVQAAPGVGLRNVVTDVIFSATGTANAFKLLQGSTDLLEIIYVAADATWSHSFRTPLEGADNALIAVTTTGATAHSVIVSGYVEEA